MGCTSSSVVVARPECIVSTASELAFRADFDKEYIPGALLGKGSFGCVYAARELSSGRLRAVKVLGSCEARQGVPKFVDAEITAWRKVGRHPNVVELIDTFDHNGCYCAVMERCQRTVDQARKSDPYFAGDGFPKLVRGMLLGIQACYAANIVHRDVKPDNFLLGFDDNTVKLCDFGLAAMLPTVGGLTGEYGTAPFMSPEMLLGEAYDTSTDVWSLGVVAYVTLFRELPYSALRQSVGSNPDKKGNSEAMKQAIRAGEPPRKFVEEGPQHPAVPLLRLLLERDPLRRCSADGALSHPFVADTLPDICRGLSRQSSKQRKSSGTDSLSTTDFMLNTAGHSTASTSTWD